MKRILLVLVACCLGGAPIFGSETNDVRTLTRAEARALALRNHPQIAAANYQALAAEQVLRQARSGFFPTASLAFTAAGADSKNTRLMAGALNNPSVFDRAAGGLIVSQLITDFGRTGNLTASRRLHFQAETQNTLATRELILLQVDVSYFSALQAKAVLGVAQQTLETRSVLLNYVSTMASNQLKAALDVSFAQVAFEEGRLLLERAENDSEAALAALSTAVGYRELQHFVLVEEPLPASGSVDDIPDRVRSALQARPDLQRLRSERDAALRFAKSERDLHNPTLLAIGTIGDSPFHDDRLPDTYGAAAVTLNIPLFAGGFYSARQREAELRAQADAEALRAAEDNVVRDVRVACLNVNSALERIRTTEQLLSHATEAYHLAEARYRVGSSSIVELSPVQLSLTSAQIAHANARYDVLIQQSSLQYQTGVLSAGPF